MTIDQVLQMVGTMTTDASGQIGRFSFHHANGVGQVEAVLDKSAGASAHMWRIMWSAHWRTDQGQEQRESSPDLRGLLSRFPNVNLETSQAQTLDDLKEMS